MLVDVTFMVDPILDSIAKLNDGPAMPERLSQGLYLAGHWNVGDLIIEPIIDPFDDGPPWPDYDESGVCDTPAQVVEKFDLQNRDGRFAVSFVRLRRDEQPSWHGWRWHKWGTYIGNQNPQYEYLYNEPDIEEVFTYAIYKLADSIDGSAS